MYNNSDKHKYAPVTAPIYGGNLEAIESATALEEKFVTPVTAPPSCDADPYLEVTAPSTLPEGYSFEVESNGHSFTVKVPVGGVEEGQKFSVPFPAGSTGYSGSAIPRASVPVGHWKDGLCNCCTHGMCHPHLWNAYCCTLIATGQVMHRLKLTWYGDRGNSIAQTAGTFRTIFWIAVSYIAIRVTFTVALLGLAPEPQHYGEVSQNEGIIFALDFFNRILALVYAIFLVYVIAKTRNHIRSKYGIPQTHCHGEDCCCAFWCTCCTVAQMARHTADYDNYAARCCGETGLGPNAPSIV